jgi:sugar/nucleoside kinase (ribokinase family)
MVPPAALTRNGVTRCPLHRYESNHTNEPAPADDALAATVVAALVAGLPFQDALRRAAVNAMSVKHEIASQAGLLTAEALDACLDEANDFVVVVQ